MEISNSNIDNINIEKMLQESIKFKHNDGKLVGFYTGHHGYRWSIIYMDSNNLYFYNGNTVAEINESKEDCSFDTVSFIDSNLMIIKWGLDSLYIQANRMKPVYPEKYNPFFTNLFVFDAKNNYYFETDNVHLFSGPDSVEFNNKFHRLSFIMLWLASPQIRTYIPKSEIFEM